VVARSSFLSVLLVLLALLKAVATTRLRMSWDMCATLNQALRGAAQLHLSFGVPLVLGLEISGFISGSQQPSVIQENHSGCTAEAIGDGSTTCAATQMAGDLGRSHLGGRLEAI
jgi:hypothetical protein